MSILKSTKRLHQLAASIYTQKRYSTEEISLTSIMSVVQRKYYLFSLFSFINAKLIFIDGQIQMNQSDLGWQFWTLQFQQDT
jgi:hypothetical protein